MFVYKSERGIDHNCIYFKKTDNENSFLDIYNWGMYVIRFNGVYYTGGFAIRFLSPQLTTLEHYKITFPDDAMALIFFIQKWSFVQQTWTTIGRKFENLLGEIYYRTAETFETARFDRILCP